MLEHLTGAIAEAFEEMLDICRTHHVAPEQWWCGCFGEPAVVNALQEGFGIFGLIGHFSS